MAILESGFGVSQGRSFGYSGEAVAQVTRFNEAVRPIGESDGPTLLKDANDEVALQGISVQVAWWVHRK